MDQGERWDWRADGKPRLMAGSCLTSFGSHPVTGLAAAGLGRLKALADAGLDIILAPAHVGQQSLLDALALEGAKGLVERIAAVYGYLRKKSPPFLGMGISPQSVKYILFLMLVSSN